MHREAAAAAGLVGGMREQGVLGGASDRLADALGDDQRAGDPQRCGDAQQWDGDDGQGVARDRPRPEPSGAIGQRPGYQAQAQRGGFPYSGDQSDHQAGRPERGQ